jgi:PIN domain nuclease of toxin-antitoxin system
MKLLLDTQTALWWVNDYEKLSPKAKDLLLDEGCALYISVVSVWEIAMKAALGKLTGLNGGVKKFIAKVEEMPVSILPVTTSHIELIEYLPFIHRDPFDRLLISTAIAEDSTILTADKNIQQYNVKWVW